MPATGARAQTGACCDVNGVCTSTDQCTCFLNGGEFQGVGSMCQPGTQCPLAGACCTANGCTYVLPSVCTSLMGTFFVSQTCAIGVCPPQPTGACCCRQTICIDTDFDLCKFANGVFIANQTCANANPCVGACCGPAFGQCTLVPQGQCAAAAGQTWLGGTSCNPNPCVPTTFVQCCLNGNCIFASYCDCVFKNGIIYPSGTPPCTPASCVPQQVGSCCTPSGICVQTNLVMCQQYLGSTTFLPGVPCVAAPCNNTPPITCCCGGACKMTDPQMCNLAHGTIYPAGTLCQPDPCNGACCNPLTGACFAPVSQQQCQAQGGIYVGGLYSCQPNPCTGACCDPATGNCFLTMQSACPVPPNQWFGTGSSCNPPPCHPTGACCDPVTGLCTIVTLTCPGPNDIYMGPNTTCQPNPCVVCCDPITGTCMQIPAGANGCPAGWQQYPGISCNPPAPCPPQLGACCRSSGTGLPGGCFTNIPQSQCQAPDLWLGPGTTCLPDKCPGACCNPQTGVCVYTAASQCPFPVPPPFLYLVSCTNPQNPCPQPPPTGACCNPLTGQCQVVAQTACPASNIWLGPNTGCQPNPCKVCCDPNSGNCFPMPAAGCQLPFTTVVATSCLPNNPCPPATPTGACCFTTGICQVVQVTQCVAPNVYMGNGTTCAANTCLRCCNPTTGACTPAFAFFGQVFCFNGSVLQFGTTCTPNPCPPPGACCKTNGTCVQATQANCPTPNIWLGPGTTCQPNTCRRCCLNGQCYTPFVFGGTFACISGSTVVFATSCTPNPCPPPIGACCVGPKFGCPPTGNTCIQLTLAQCNAQGGMWQGVQPCQAPPGSGNFKPCCKANFNMQNGVSVQDIFSFLAAWLTQLGMSGSNPPLTADFNCSGTVTIQDLFDFLTAYFTGCH